MIIYHRRERPSQKMFTPEEYAAMGYMQRDDYDPSMFQSGSYSSFKSFDINFLNLPVYRADTKEEFAFDALMLLGSFTTGGTTGGFKFLSTKLKSD
jgi:hypothetical protein